MMKFIKKYAFIVGLLLALFALKTLIYDSGSKDKDIEGRLFKTVEDRVMTDTHMKTFPNDVDAYVAFKRMDTIAMLLEEAIKENKENKDDAIRSRARRDSVGELNAVENYQQKVLMQKILGKLDSIQSHN